MELCAWRGHSHSETACVCRVHVNMHAVTAHIRIKFLLWRKSTLRAAISTISCLASVSGLSEAFSHPTETCRRQTRQGKVWVAVQYCKSSSLKGSALSGSRDGRLCPWRSPTCLYCKERQHLGGALFVSSTCSTSIGVPARRIRTVHSLQSAP